MNGVDEVKRALRSLPWYLLGGLLFLPLVLAPFTAGDSLLLYVLYFGKPDWLNYGIPLSIAFGIWLLRQFVRAAKFAIDRADMG